jgi:hypothetical protein
MPSAQNVERRWWMIVVVLIAMGCTEPNAPTTLPIRPSISSIDSLDPIPVLAVTLAAPTTLQLIYWSDSTAKLEITVAVDSASVTIPLLRARANTRYWYQLRSISAGGLSSAPVTGKLTTAALPADLAQLSFTATGTPTDPVTMLEVNATFKGFVAVDAQGQVVWYWRTTGPPQAFTRRANGNFVFNDLGTGLFEVTGDGEIVHKLDASTIGTPPHHDVIATPQNTILFIAHEDGTGRGMTLTGDAIWEWVPETGALAKRWTTFGALDPAVDWGSRSMPSDWVHANALSIGPHGNIIFSMYLLGQIISIAPDWHSLEWRLGGIGSTFTVDADAAFDGQHNPQLLSATDIIFFDNGLNRADGAQYSRGLEVTMDTVTHIAHRAWQFRPSPDIFAPIIGSIHRFENGNTLMHFGVSPVAYQGATGPIVTYEVTSGGQVVWSLTTGNARTVYRATPLAAIGSEKPPQ